MQKRDISVCILEGTNGVCVYFVGWFVYCLRLCRFAQQSGLAIKQANGVASLGRVPLLDVAIKGWRFKGVKKRGTGVSNLSSVGWSYSPTGGQTAGTSMKLRATPSSSSSCPEVTGTLKIHPDVTRRLGAGREVGSSRRDWPLQSYRAWSWLVT